MKKIKGITVEVKMYEAVCDGCGKVNSSCKTFKWRINIRGLNYGIIYM